MEETILKIMLKLLLGIAAGVSAIGSYMMTQDKAKLDRGLDEMLHYVETASEESDKLGL